MGCILSFVCAHWSNQWHKDTHIDLTLSLCLDAQFPIDISSVTRDHDFLDRDAIEALCRWNFKSHWTFCASFLFLLMLHAFSFLCYLLFSPLEWSHEGMTSKGGMLWKVAYEMKEWHDKHLGAMHCTFSSLHSVLHAHTFFFSREFASQVFTSVIRVFCILASRYLAPTFHCGIATVTQCSLHSQPLCVIGDSKICLPDWGISGFRVPKSFRNVGLCLWRGLNDSIIGEDWVCILVGAPTILISIWEEG